MEKKRSNSISSDVSDSADNEGGKKTYTVSKSRLLSLIDWMTVIRRYLPIVWFCLIGILIVQIAIVLYEHRFDLTVFYYNEMAILELQRKDALGLGWKTVLVLAMLIAYVNRMENLVYLMDFACFEPPASWKLSPEQILEIMRRQNCFTDDSLAFLERMLKQSGCGPSTAWPPGIVRCLEGLPQDNSAEAARRESETVIFDCVRNVLARTKVKAQDISILVVNCSLFSPTPSLCSMVINEFGMRPDTSSYNLSGMGCSAGIISIELVRNLLRARPNSLALIVSTENLTQNLYHGNERSFLLQNTLFRCGGAAVILSNRWIDAFQAQFKLLHVERTQYVSEDSYGCVYETEDTPPSDGVTVGVSAPVRGQRGVRLSKDIVKVAGRALERNLTALGPHVLPISEQFKTAVSMLLRFLAKQAVSMGVISKINSNSGVSNIPSPYIPDFKRGLDHFCIHAGGRGVIDGIEKNLHLCPEHVAASRHALYTYGNTSSSSIWYEMDYLRNRPSINTTTTSNNTSSSSDGMYSGQRILQLAFGSGFKCNSAVWLCINTPTPLTNMIKTIIKNGSTAVAAAANHTNISKKAD